MKKTKSTGSSSKLATDKKTVKQDPVGFLQEFVVNATQLLEVSMMGLRKLEGAPALVEAVLNLKCVEESREMGENEHREVKTVTEAAEFAKKEREKDFPLLRSDTRQRVGSAGNLCRGLHCQDLAGKP